MPTYLKVESLVVKYVIKNIVKNIYSLMPDPLRGLLFWDALKAVENWGKLRHTSNPKFYI